MNDTDITDKTKTPEWIQNKEHTLTLQSMMLHDIKTLVLPTDDEDTFINIAILRVIGGWIYWSDETNLSAFVPDRRDS
jgi:hypothetical protein